MLIMAKPLNDYREERYLSIDEFAAVLGVAVQTLYRISHGMKARPTTMRKIAQALGVHPSDITEFALHRDANVEQNT